MQNLKDLDLWDASVCYYVNKAGIEINPNDYPNDTKIIRVRHIELDEYEIQLDV